MKQTEALKLALEVSEEFIADYQSEDGMNSMKHYAKKHHAVLTAIREALADQPAQQQEPMAWLIWLHGPAGHFDHKQFAELEFERRNKEYPDPDRKLLPLYTSPPAAQQQKPTVEDNSQNWRGMDGTTAYWLIQRHADGWADIGKMMGEWLEANQAQPAPVAEPHKQQEPDRVKFERHWRKTRGEKKANRELPRHPLQPQTYIQDSANRHWVTWQAAVRSVSPLANANAGKPWVGLTDEEIEARAINFYNPEMYKRAVLWAQEKLKERNQ